MNDEKHLSAIEVAQRCWVTADECLKYLVAIPDGAILCQSGRFVLRTAFEQPTVLDRDGNLVADLDAQGNAEIQVAPEQLDEALKNMPLLMKALLKEFLRLNPERCTENPPNIIYTKWRAEYGKAKPKLLFQMKALIGARLGTDGRFRSMAGIVKPVTHYWFEGCPAPFTHYPPGKEATLNRKQDRAAKRSPKHGLSLGENGVTLNGRTLSEVPFKRSLANQTQSDLPPR